MWIKSPVRPAGCLTCLAKAKSATGAAACSKCYQVSKPSVCLKCLTTVPAHAALYCSTVDPSKSYYTTFISKLSKTKTADQVSRGEWQPQILTSCATFRINTLQLSLIHI